jgi:glycosyltransferase involved in cell wall biosynthesis
VSRILAIIPVYNESLRIEEVIRKTLPHVDEVIVVDDGSHDGTEKVALAAGARVIRHPHNLGKGAACRTGFQAAVHEKAEGIVMLDGDGQHEPDEIPKLVKEGVHTRGLVIGNRMENTEDMPKLRYLTNRLLSLLVSCLAGQSIQDSQCGFRFLHRSLLEAVDYENNRYDAESEILVRASRKGFPISHVPIETIYRDEFSKIHVFWDTLRFIRFFFRHLFGSPPIQRKS